MASVREIARKTGFSAATVSRALKAHPDVSEATRNIVFSVAEEVGYLSSNSRSLSSNVGYVLTHNNQLWEYDWMLIDGLIAGLRENRLDVSIIDLHKGKTDDESYSQFFLRRGLSGVILRTNEENRPLCEKILAEGFPAVVVASKFDAASEANYIYCDSRTESANAVHHLADLGHRRIAHVIYRRADSDHLDRYYGYREACEARGLDRDETLEVQIMANLKGGKTALNRLMSLAEPPTAIVFADPLPALGAMLRAQEIGLRIPQDLSLIGFDD